MRITTQQAFDSIIELMATRPSAALGGVEIDFESIGNQSANIQRFCAALKTFASTSLSLQNQPWSDIILAQVIGALEHNQTITTLDLSKNRMGRLSAVALTPVLFQRRITQLDVSNNPLGSALDQILRAIKSGSSIETFTMRNTHPVGGAHSAATAELIHSASLKGFIKNIYIGENHFDVQAWDNLRGNSKTWIKEFDQCHAFLSTSSTSSTSGSSVSTPEAFNSILELMATRPSAALNGVEIDFERIGNQSYNIERFCTALKTLASTSLSLQNQPWSDAILAQVIGALKYNQTITTLDLSKNRMGQLSAAALAPVLSQRRITQLDVSDNPLGSALDQILRAIKSGSRVETFTMRNTHPVGGHSEATAELIHKASLALSISRIYIGRNNFDDQAWRNLKGNQNNWIREFGECHALFSPSSTSGSAASVYSSTTTSSSSWWQPPPTVSSTSTSAPPPTAPKRQFFYAVSSERLRGTADMATTVDEAHDIFKKSKQFRVFTTLAAAQDDRRRKKQEGWFGAISYPVVFEMVTKSEYDIAEEMNIEKHHIDIANFYCSEGPTNIMKTSRDETTLLELIQGALVQYSRGINSTASFGSADEGGGMCSTLIDDSTAANHSTSGVDRATKFVDSLSGLDLKSMLKEMKAYNEGFFTGNYEKEKSFKAILLDKLYNRYAGWLYTRIYSQESLNEMISTVESTIKRDVSSEMSQLKPKMFSNVY